MAIRVAPGSARPGVGGAAAVPGNEPCLVVRVAARAVDGKATEAALRALAEALGVRRRDVTLVRGATSRTKLVEIDAPAAAEAALRDRLDTLLQSH